MAASSFHLCLQATSDDEKDMLALLFRDLSGGVMSQREL